jgi:hypothetical protein
MALDRMGLDTRHLSPALDIGVEWIGHDACVAGSQYFMPVVPSTYPSSQSPEKGSQQPVHVSMHLHVYMYVLCRV